MLTYSSFDHKSHQGTSIMGVRHDYYIIYDVEVFMKDSANVAEIDSCSSSSYADCVDQQTHHLFAKVSLKT